MNDQLITSVVDLARLDKIVEQTAKLLGVITHSNFHSASTERNKLPVHETLKLIGRCSDINYLNVAAKLNEARRVKPETIAEPQ